MKRHLLILTTFILLLAFTSCKDLANRDEHKLHPALYATLFQQRAAEYKALCFQAYNLAELRLANYDFSDTSKPQAIVVDIDETILDNSPYQAKAIMNDFSYPVQWKEWIEAAKAETVPGAVEFLNNAAAHSIKIFYITNRKEQFREATLKNLVDKGFPNAENEFLLMRTSGNEKETRRNMVREDYKIILLMGDNLGDFSNVFDTSDADKRMQEVDQHQADFGDRWIVLPNPVYGSWMNALPGYDEASAQQDDRLLEKGLIGF